MWGHDASSGWSGGSSSQVTFSDADFRGRGDALGAPSLRVDAVGRDEMMMNNKKRIRLSFGRAPSKVAHPESATRF